MSFLRKYSTSPTASAKIAPASRHSASHSPLGETRRGPLSGPGQQRSHQWGEVERDPDEVAVEPYGPASPDFVIGAEFPPMWVSMLVFCQGRFAGTLPYFKDEPSGGLDCFTPDNFPVFDVFRQNCYFIADSNHGYKMIGIGDWVSREIPGQSSDSLKPSRLERYAAGELHPTSNSPFPLS